MFDRVESTTGTNSARYTFSSLQPLPAVEGWIAGGRKRARGATEEEEATCEFPEYGGIKSSLHLR